jgi:hypothetical protein
MLVLPAVYVDGVAVVAGDVVGALVLPLEASEAALDASEPRYETPDPAAIAEFAADAPAMAAGATNADPSKAPAAIPLLFPETFM